MCPLVFLSFALWRLSWCLLHLDWFCLLTPWIICTCTHVANLNRFSSDSAVPTAWLIFMSSPLSLPKNSLPHWTCLNLIPSNRLPLVLLHSRHPNCSCRQSYLSEFSCWRVLREMMLTNSLPVKILLLLVTIRWCTYTSRTYTPFSSRIHSLPLDLLFSMKLPDASRTTLFPFATIFETDPRAFVTSVTWNVMFRTVDQSKVDNVNVLPP